MKDFFQLLMRFVPPYRKYLFLNILFNFLAAFLTLFSFALIIPILEMLFKVKEASYEFMPRLCLAERRGNQTTSTGSHRSA